MRVDHFRERFASSFYLKFGEELTGHSQNELARSKLVFREIVDKCSANKGYIFGTGPNLKLAKGHDFSDGVCVACNSMIQNDDLMHQLKPKIIVVADPIFHAGPSVYASKFRKKLIEVLGAHGSFLVVPSRDIHIYKSFLPQKFIDRVCAIPFKNQEKPNLDLKNHFFVSSTANVLTLFLLPLSASLFKEVALAGCDGRPRNENSYFWKHDKGSQFNTEMSLIKEAHPAFFSINYDDYYEEHCETLEKWLTQMESAEITIKNLTPSYIPALKSREFLLNSDHQAPTEVAILDPDAINHFGHYLAYDERLREAVTNNGIRFSALVNNSCSSKILKSRSWMEPTFSKNSWIIGLNQNPGKKDLEEFSFELRNALLRKFETDPEARILLYMYCGSLGCRSNRGTIGRISKCFSFYMFVLAFFRKLFRAEIRSEMEKVYKPFSGQ